MRAFHRVTHAPNKFLRHLLVKQVAHRVHEDHSWFSPSERLIEALGPQRQIESVFKWMAGRPAKTLGEAFSVTVIAACADLCAASDWVPRRIRPLDSRAACHLRLQREADKLYTHSRIEWLICLAVTYRLFVPVEIRPDVGPARAAGGAGEFFSRSDSRVSSGH